MASTSTPAPGPVSVSDAVNDAIGHTRRQLFPFSFTRWVILGFLAFLDQCGRSWSGGGPGRADEPAGPWPPGDGDFAEGMTEAVDTAAAWLSEHALAVALGATAILLLVAGVLAVVLWINARGTFMYLDDVASGRADVSRPWRQHARAAHSYFAWRFVLSLATFLVVVLGISLVAVAAVGFARGRLDDALGGAAVMALLPVLVVLALALPLLVLAGVALRDFVAPLQLTTGLTCGQAARVLEALVIAHPGVFVLYVLLKLVLAVGIGIAAFAVGCLTCCVGFLPVVAQTVLQPVYYFERAWPVFLLRQMGHDLPDRLAAIPDPTIRERPVDRR